MKQLLTVMFGLAAVSFCSQSVDAGLQTGVTASTSALAQSALSMDVESPAGIQLVGHCHPGYGGGYGGGAYYRGGGYGGFPGGFYPPSYGRSYRGYGGGFPAYGRGYNRGYNRGYGRGGVSFFIGF